MVVEPSSFWAAHLPGREGWRAANNERSFFEECGKCRCGCCKINQRGTEWRGGPWTEGRGRGRGQGHDLNTGEPDPGSQEGSMAPRNELQWAMRNASEKWILIIYSAPSKTQSERRVPMKASRTRKHPQRFSLLHRCCRVPVSCKQKQRPQFSILQVVPRELPLFFPSFLLTFPHSFPPTSFSFLFLLFPPFILFYSSLPSSSHSWPSNEKRSDNHHRAYILYVDFR